MTTSSKSSLLDPTPVLWTPDADQRRGVKFLLEHACAGIYADPGAGKTSMALQAFKILLHEGVEERMLVICPLRPAYMVWPAEVAAWQQFTGLRLCVLHGDDKEEKLRAKADVFVTTPETLPWLFTDQRWRRLGATLLAVDECSKFKHMRTQRYQALRPFLPKFRRRWEFTGSPAPNGLLDLHGQVFLLDLGRTFTPYISHYRSKFFMPTGHEGYTWVIKDGAEKEIFQRLAPYVLRLESEGKGTPELVNNNVYVELPPKARRVYDQLEAELFALIDDKEVTAFNAGALSIKCRQVASGGVYEDMELDEKTGLPKREGKRRWIALHEAKTEATLELHDELQGKQLFIGYWWQHDLERLRKAFGKDLAVMGGGKTLKQDIELERAWNKRDVQVMAAHPASIGHGLNLQKGGAQHVLFYTGTYDYELYDQFIRRIRRRGNPKKKVYVHHLLARDTLDTAQLMSVNQKARTQRALYAALMAYRRSRK